MKLLIRQYIIISFFLFIPNILIADVVFLNDGTILNGKITQKNKFKISLKNLSGTISIKKKDIKEFFITKSFEEDYELIKIKKQDPDFKKIKKNYLAGATAEKLSNKKLFSNSLNFSGAVMFMFGGVEGVLPYGYAVFLTYFYKFNKFIKPHEKYGTFALSLDSGFIHYPHENGEALGPNFSIGITWFVPIKRQKAGGIRFGILPGVSYFLITRKSDDFKVETVSFTLNSILGYEYTIKQAILFFQLRITYIYDSKVVLLNTGFEAGAGVKF